MLVWLSKRLVYYWDLKELDSEPTTLKVKCLRLLPPAAAPLLPEMILTPYVPIPVISTPSGLLALRTPKTRTLTPKYPYPECGCGFSSCQGQGRPEDTPGLPLRNPKVYHAVICLASAIGLYTIVPLFLSLFPAFSHTQPLCAITISLCSFSIFPECSPVTPRSPFSFHLNSLVRSIRLSSL